MSRRIVKLPDFSNVAISGRATLALPVGARKYHKLIFQYKIAADNQATIEAGLLAMRVLVNGRVQRECLVSELNVINAYRGRAFQTGFVTVYLSDNGARTIAGEEVLGWGTFNLSSLSVEIDISGAAVAPALTAFAEIEDSTEPLGAIMKIRKSTYSPGAASVLAHRDFPRDPREAYARFHIMSVLATSVQLKADSDVIVETITRTMLANHYAGRPQETIMQANVLTLDLLASRQTTDMLPMLRTDGRTVQDLPLEVTYSGAGTVPIVVEVVGPAT